MDLGAGGRNNGRHEKKRLAGTRPAARLLWPARTPGPGGAIGRARAIGHTRRTTQSSVHRHRRPALRHAGRRAPVSRDAEHGSAGGRGCAFRKRLRDDAHLRRQSSQPADRAGRAHPSIHLRHAAARRRISPTESYPVLLREAGYRTGFVGKFGVRVQEGAVDKMFDTYEPFAARPTSGNWRTGRRAISRTSPRTEPSSF